MVERCRTSRFFPDSGPLGESGTDKCAVEPCDFGLSEELTSERAWFDFWEEHLEPSAVGWDSPENKAIFRFANAVCPGHIETPMGLAVLAGDSGIQALHPPASEAQHRSARNVLPGGNTRTTLHYSPFPLTFASAEGAVLTSVDGDRYVDLLGDYTAGLYGHSNPVILETIRTTLSRGLNYGGQNLDEARLAKILTDRFPSVELIRFTNSGTEANLLALVTATAHTGRKAVVVFEGGYHGSVLTFTSGDVVTNAPFDFILANYNDVEGGRSLLRRLGDEVAAVLVEPMLGSGGCVPADPEFLRMLREETSRSGSLLTFDEVMTSRLSPGGAQQTFHISPDLTTFGKYIGGGMSFGAFGGRRDLMESFDPMKPGSWAHAGTFNNNVLSMAAGVAGLERVFTAEACVALNVRGEVLREQLNEVLRDGGIDMQVSGWGSLMTFHGTANPISDASHLVGSNDLVKELLFFHLLSEGFWIARRRMIALSLAVSDDDCARLVSVVRAFVHEYKRVLPKRRSCLVPVAV